MNGGRSFFDTNVLVYMFDEANPAKKARARELLASEKERGGPVLSTQVLQEFYVTVRKLPRPLGAEEALTATVKLTVLRVAQITVATVLAAIELSQRHSFSFWDALIVETALAAECDRLLSEDLQPGRRFGNLVIENPFAA